MKKPIKGKPKRMYTEGEVSAILEDIRDQFRAFGEGQDVVANAQEAMSSKLDVIDDRLTRVERDVFEIKHSLARKSDRQEVQSLEKRVVALEKKVFAKLR